MTTSIEIEQNYEQQIKKLERYKLNKNLKSGDIFHLYPIERAFPNGYYDSMFFNLWVFNTKTMEKRVIKYRDGLTFLQNVKIDIVRIFIDGSFLMRFKEVQNIDIFQDCLIGNNLKEI